MSDTSDLSASPTARHRDQTGNARGMPLQGLRVLEFGHIAAGPFASSLLADLGADVVKIESPQGDGLREWPPFAKIEDDERFSLNFAALNRNKKSVRADLKRSEDLLRVRELCRQADVLIENYRPGVLGRLGLGFQDVSRLNEHIIYCSISGYGQCGPYVGRGAFDVAVQAMSGLMSVTGQEDGAPVKCGVPVGDFVAGLYGAFSVLAAYVGRTGRASAVHIDCAMLDCLLGISALQTSEFWGTETPPRRLGSAHPRNAPYQAFTAADRDFIVAAGTNQLWRMFCEAISRPELFADPRFESITLRARNQKELAAILAPIFEIRPAREWLCLFDFHGIPCAPVNDFRDILNEPHLRARGLLQSLRLPSGATTSTLAFPVMFSGEERSSPSPPPRLGEHGDAGATDCLAHVWSIREGRQ